MLLFLSALTTTTVLANRHIADVSVSESVSVSVEIVISERSQLPTFAADTVVEVYYLEGDLIIDIDIDVSTSFQQAHNCFTLNLHMLCGCLCVSRS